MLRTLALRDFAVVDTLELEFADGMTVVSGETGAGKSLLVDALLWLTGARADAGIVRHGAERAELAAEFALDDAPDAAAWLREAELDDDDGSCQLRRVIRADGGSRAWINGRPATLAQLAELGGRLVEIHGQHEHQALLARGPQLELLDAFGRHAAPVKAVRVAAADCAALEARIAALSATGDVGERIAFLEHQLAELGREALAPGGIDELLASHRRQSHAAALLQGCDAALDRLAGDDGPSLARTLRQVAVDLERLREHEPGLAEVVQGLDSAGIQLEEAARTLAHLRDGFDLDPTRLAELDARLARLHELSRRFRVPLEQLEARRDALASELDQLRGAGAALDALLVQREPLLARWREAAAELTRMRTRAAAALGEAVTGLMAELGMPGGVFVAALEPGPAGPHPLGAERVEFLVSANPGQPPRPLRKVASGGELARIALAIEVAALGLDPVPTMVFDEVDSGIGGAVAEVVGRKLRTLAGRCQVMCVTHLPQVAAQGHHHLQVRKSVHGGATRSDVTALDGKARVEELARMLGGVEVGKQARDNARDMLARAARA
jgi:DNA repair protein RecN (Recombination protein N)